MHFVRKAEHLAGYRLMIGFEDGTERIIDLGPYLDGEIFEPLKSLEYFRKFRVNPDLDTVVWDNGADFSPDFLYEQSSPVSRAEAVADH
jgi:hypothetical protein